jgi:hypothetical protein
LLVTTLLSLVTMFDTVRNNSPDALELKSIEVSAKMNFTSPSNYFLQPSHFFKVWLLCCTFFVFLALMEYFVVLFGIRYDSHWRRSQLVAQAAQNFQPQPSPARINLSNQNLQIPSSVPNLPNVETPVRYFHMRNEDKNLHLFQFSCISIPRLKFHFCCL